MSVPFTHVSPSQGESFATCNRIWFYDKVLKIPQPTTFSQEVGIEKHAEIEDYLKNGTLPRSEVIKEAVRLGLLPKPKTPKMIVESNSNMPTYPGGPVWIGRIDRAHEPDGKNPPTVADNKTTSNLRYAKTPAEMAETLQMNSYAKWMQVKFKWDGPVNLEHLYLQVGKGKPPTPKLVQALRSADQIEERWQRGLDDVRVMQDLAKTLPDVKDIKPSLNVCNKFYGKPCPYIDRCPRSMFGGISMEGSMGMNFGGNDDKPAEIKKESKMAGVNGASNGSNGKTLEDRAQELAQGVSPPDAPEAAKTPEELEQKAIVAVTGDKPKRGRPRKDATQTQAENNTAVVSQTVDGLQIYVDCMPVKPLPDNLIMFEDWIAPIADGIAKDKAIEDYRLLPFGAGKAELAAAIRRAPVPQGTLVIAKYTPGADEALSVLIPKAGLVVRAL